MPSSCLTSRVSCCHCLPRRPLLANSPRTHLATDTSSFSDHATLCFSTEKEANAQNQRNALVFPQGRYDQAMVRQLTAEDQDMSITGAAWLPANYAQMLIGRDSAVTISHTLLRSEDHDVGETLMLSTETCTVTAAEQGCGRSAPMLFYRCDDGGGELEIILPVYHSVQPQREAAAAAAAAAEEDNGTCALTDAVIRFCFHVTVIVETGVTTIDLVRISEADRSFTVVDPALNLYIHDPELAPAGSADARPEVQPPGYFNRQNILSNGTHMVMFGDTLVPTPMPLAPHVTWFGRTDADVYPANNNPSCPEPRASAFGRVVRESA